MPATHHSSPPPTRSTDAAPPIPADTAPPVPEPPSAGDAAGIGRIPILDVRPVVHHGRRPAKAVTGESFEIS
ncbi:maltotransferase domain-containing protein, partial [Streptomyces sp. 7R007]